MKVLCVRVFFFPGKSQDQQSGQLEWQKIPCVFVCQATDASFIWANVWPLKASLKIQVNIHDVWFGPADAEEETSTSDKTLSKWAYLNFVKMKHIYIYPF